MSEFSFYIDATTYDEVMSAAEPISMPTVEENVTFVPGKKDGTGKWSEGLKIVDTSLGPDKKDPNVAVFCIIAEITNDVSDKNAGRPYRYYQYVDMVALKDRKHEHYRWNNQRLAKINGLLKTFGIDTAEGIHYEEWFNGEKPLQGQKVGAVFNRYKYIGKQSGAEETRTEADGFFAIG